MIELPKQIIYGSEARSKLMEGINGVADAIKPTLGPAARTVVLQRNYGNSTVINDGVTIARDISFADPFVNMGAKFIQEVATNAQDNSGDGTSTASILAQALCESGMKAMNEGSNPIAIKRGINDAVTAVSEYLTSMAKEVGEADLVEVASIAANNDEEIGILIAQAFEKVGAEGIITVEEAKGVQTELVMVEGMELERGYASPYMITDPQKLIAEYVDPLILLTDERITNIQELLPVLEHSIQSKRPLVILARSIEGEALSTLVLNRLQGSLNVVGVEIPGFGEDVTAKVKDLGVLLSALPILEEGSATIVEDGVEGLGSASRIVVTKSKTTIVNDGGDFDAIQEYANELKGQMEGYDTEWEKDSIRHRIGSLTGGVCVLRIGATTETEMQETKARVDDSLNATRAAIEEGIVAGGGIALLRSRSHLDYLVMNSDYSDDEKLGIQMVRDSLDAPFRQIILNCGEDVESIYQTLEIEESDLDWGYNARTRQFENLLKTGVVDPVKITRNSILSAASIAGLVLTTEVLVADLPQPTKQQGEEPPLIR